MHKAIAMTTSHMTQAEDDAADEVVKVDDATLLGTVESETVSVRETEEDEMLLEAAAEES